MSLIIHLSDDVLANLEYVKDNPDSSRLYSTDLVFCEADFQCNHRFKVRAKDADFITWYCPEHYHLAPWANNILDEWEN